MDSNLIMELSIPIPNVRHAEIVFNSLRIDKEPKRNRVTKDLELQENIIKIKWQSKDAKNLRASTSGFFDHLNLCLQTIENFDSINTLNSNICYNMQDNDNIDEYVNDNKDEYNECDCEDNGDDTVRNLPLRSLQVPGTKYEYLDHTADVQIHAWGDSLLEAFEQAVEAMFGYVTEIDKVEEIFQQEIEADGDDMMSLLYHLLDEFLYIFSVDSFFIAKRVKIIEFDKTNFKIKAIGFGETFDIAKHPQGTEVKAITYSNMQIYDEEERHEVFVIIDI